MASIILDVAIVFVIYCLGFAVGFGTCAGIVREEQEENERED